MEDKEIQDSLNFTRMIFSQLSELQKQLNTARINPDSFNLLGKMLSPLMNEGDSEKWKAINDVLRKSEKKDYRTWAFDLFEAALDILNNRKMLVKAVDEINMED